MQLVALKPKEFLCEEKIAATRITGGGIFVGRDIELGTTKPLAKKTAAKKTERTGGLKTNTE